MSSDRKKGKSFVPQRKVREKRIQGEGVLYVAAGSPDKGDYAAGLFVPEGGFVICPFAGKNNPVAKWARKRATGRKVPFKQMTPDNHKHWARRELFTKFPQAAEVVRRLAEEKLELDPTDPWLKSFVDTEGDDS